MIKSIASPDPLISSIMDENRAEKLRVQPLQLSELLDFSPDNGTIFLGQKRMMIQSASAFGYLRRELISALGIDAARRLLTRYGYAHGYKEGSDARFVEAGSVVKKIELGSRIHAIFGIASAEPLYVDNDPNGPGFHLEAIWRSSLEAEEHIRHLGTSPSPVCWSMVGYVCGFVSAMIGKEIYFREESCAGQGHSHCRLEARDAAGWGAELHSIQSDFMPFTAGNESGMAELRAELDALAEDVNEKNRQLFSLQRQLYGQDPENDELRARLTSLEQTDRFIVRGRAMTEAIDRASRVAPLQTSVLICGESGTGKEFFANFIHKQSTRSQQSFVSLNCAALTDTLLESELFGHVKGAFTGAIRDKAGLFEVAANGTLFLDEIGEIPQSVQAKLLRALEQGEIRRVGSDRSIRVHPRIIAATNKELTASSNDSHFRKDLYFRLAGFVIQLPPLRERRESIPPLVHHFLARARQSFHLDLQTVTPDCMAALTGYSWPGNVRELKHAVEQAAIVAKHGVVDTSDLPSEIASFRAGHYNERLMYVTTERTVIERVLSDNRGSRVATARDLGMSTVTLWRKMKRYGLRGDAT